MKSVTTSTYVTISAYIMQVRNTRRVGGGYYDLAHLPHGQDLLKLLVNYLSQLGTEPDDDETNQYVLKVSQFDNVGRSISGILARGEYGIRSDLLDIEKRALSYERSESDAELMPFYFLAVVPEQGTRALIAFESEGDSGIRMQFEHGFANLLERACGNCKLETEAPRRQYFQKGRVTKLRFVRLRVPTDIATAIRGGVGPHKMRMEMELQVRGERGVDFSKGGRIQDILQGEFDAKDFMQMMGFEYDTLKVEYYVGGKRRTMDLAARDKFNADYNVTAKVQMDGGHPSFPSIDDAARKIVREIMDSEGLEATGV